MPLDLAKADRLLAVGARRRALVRLYRETRQDVSSVASDKIRQMIEAADAELEDEARCPPAPVIIRSLPEFH
jgi:hypothetical protein